MEEQCMWIGFHNFSFSDNPDCDIQSKSLNYSFELQMFSTEKCFEIAWNSDGVRCMSSVYGEMFLRTLNKLIDVDY